MRILGLVLLAFLIFGCGATSERPDAPGSNMEANAEATKTASETAHASKLRKVIINASSGEKVKVRVEIADNDLERGTGLRWRENLPENRGMLFVYTDEVQRSFTMEDTVIPLSIAFMDSERRIVDIQDMKPLEAGPYDSAKPARYALEVNQGFFEERGVEVGDRAELPE
ncbi:MAG: DUF192 domain-containing protein [Actinobacteria bacterium]|nr:DUF192 domain-containing protein [Actinomycetota bacterium]